jgi:hypothetical protein
VLQLSPHIPYNSAFNDLHGMAVSETALLLNAVGLARLLKPFEICLKTIRVDGATPRDTSRDLFLDAWERYLFAAARTRCGA